MTTSSSDTPVPERVRLVIELTRINSEHLRSKARHAGAEIELEGALANHADGASSPQIDTLRERLRDAARSLASLEAARARLESQLASLDHPEAR